MIYSYNHPEKITVDGFDFTLEELQGALMLLKNEGNEAAKNGNGADWLDFMSHPVPCTETRDLVIRYAAFIYGHEWSYSPSRKTIEHTSKPGFEWNGKPSGAPYNQNGELITTVVVDKNADIPDGYVETRHFNVEKLQCWKTYYHYHK